MLVSCFVFCRCYWVVSGLASLRSGRQGGGKLATKGAVKGTASRGDSVGSAIGRLLGGVVRLMVGGWLVVSLLFSWLVVWSDSSFLLVFCLTVFVGV